MSAITNEELKEILNKHQHWILRDCDGWESMKANLRNANLCGTNLHNADLRWVNLEGANLHNANLSDANLCGVILCGADLYGASLSGANLCNADLCGANLHNANLSDASLCGACLYGADLYGASLSGASLYGTDLRNANLCNADLRDTNLHSADFQNANFYGADLCGAKDAPYIPLSCPLYGSFIGFKKAGGHIVVLEILEDAQRTSATRRKCRCNKAKVLRIENIDENKPCELTSVLSDFDSRFVYTVGEIVSVPNFNPDRFKECSAGIHFFIDRQEAVDY